MSRRLAQTCAVLIAAAAATWANAQEPSAGLVPLSDYTGELFERSKLLGDFGGERTKLAEKGVQFNVGWVQTAQSVVEGGRETGTKYGGTFDYLLLLDFHRMGLVPGALLKVRAESRYGETVNPDSGSVLPVNTDGFFPLTSPFSDDIGITVSDVTYFQYFSEKFGMFAGKFDGLDADANEFASGRGETQFMNLQLVFSGTFALLPYSTLGGGAVWMPEKNIKLQTAVFSLTDSSTTTGFDDCQGWVSASEASVQYKLGSLPGGVNLGGIYIWDTDFFDFNGQFTFEPGQGLEAPRASDTWIAYFSGWQYLYAADPAGEVVDLTDGRPDLQGIGLFWRTGLADDDVNPGKWSLSGGLGGRGLVPGRAADSYGLGYYYNRVQSGRFTNRVGLDDETQGFECFYSIAVTPSTALTFDVQWIESASTSVDDAIVLGARLKIDL